MTAADRKAERLRLQQAIDASRAEDGDQYTWGVRWDEREDLTVGFVFEPSRIWIDGEPTEELLRGTSAVQASWLTRISLYSMYSGRPYIVRGIEIGFGEDDGEIILAQCEIMAVP